ncbi:MAG: hypothetical protein IPM82_22415 [Saprospiraceae bacterium]|nr:hypothetical protein [Saprospiraceae bacterium]
MNKKGRHHLLRFWAQERHCGAATSGCWRPGRQRRPLAVGGECCKKIQGNYRGSLKRFRFPWLATIFIN